MDTSDKNHATSDGRLYLVSTPIGNLGDMTLRALEVLRSVDLIAAEDTRRTMILLKHFEISCPLESFHAYNEHRKLESLIERIRGGLKVAAVSDAGTPSVADPGFLLARAAACNQIDMEVIPGVSAVTFAVTASALPVDKFSFWGFPPVKSGRRGKFFERLAGEDNTVFFFESPHRVAKALAEIVAAVGPDTPTAVIREATKIHEEVRRGGAAELAEWAASRNLKGEFVIGVCPRGADAAPTDADED